MSLFGEICQFLGSLYFDILYKLKWVEGGSCNWNFILQYIEFWGAIILYYVFQFNWLDMVIFS